MEKEKRTLPFIPWVGGKRDYVDIIEHYAPKEFHTYIEPFLGAGAVFFGLGYKAKGTARLSDANPALINAFQVVKKHPEELIKALGGLKDRYGSETSAISREGFNFLKCEINDYLHLLDNDEYDDYIYYCAYFIYLMKTCLGSVWQISPEGKCTSSFGNFGKRGIFSENNIRECSRKLNIRSWVECKSFHYVHYTVEKGDFVYLDPPYHNETYRHQYTPERFHKKDHIQLRDICIELRKKDCAFVLSNSDTPFTRELYKDFNVVATDEARRVNSKGRNRDKTLLVWHK